MLNEHEFRHFRGNYIKHGRGNNAIQVQICNIFSLIVSILSFLQISVEDFEEYLAGQSSYIEFNDGQFTLKPMELFKLTMADFTANAELLVTDIQVQKIHKVHHIKVVISNEMRSSHQNGMSVIFTLFTIRNFGLQFEI